MKFLYVSAKLQTYINQRQHTHCFTNKSLQEMFPICFLYKQTQADSRTMDQDTKKRAREARTHFVECTIDTDTCKKYEARVQAIQTWMLQAKVTSLDEDSFALFLSDLLLKTRNPCSSTAEGYRSAIVFLQKRDGLWTQQDGLWASSATCKALVQGYGFNAKQVMPRGAVEEDLYIEMMTYIEIHQPHLTDMYQLSYLVALRPHQLISLSAGKYNGSDETLLLPDKRSKASNSFPLYCRKFVVDPVARIILERLETSAETRKQAGGDLRYLTTTHRQFTLSFNKMEAALQWEQRLGLKFDGPHTLRHGGMQHNELILEDAGLTEDDRNLVLQTTTSTKQRYIRPNTQRNNK